MSRQRAARAAASVPRRRKAGTPACASSREKPRGEQASGPVRSEGEPLHLGSDGVTGAPQEGTYADPPVAPSPRRPTQFTDQWLHARQPGQRARLGLGEPQRQGRRRRDEAASPSSLSKWMTSVLPRPQAAFCWAAAPQRPPSARESDAGQRHEVQVDEPGERHHDRVGGRTRPSARERPRGSGGRLLPLRLAETSGA